MKFKIGIAIPCYNNLDVIKQSLPSIYSDEFIIVVFDDGSTDGTERWIKENYLNVNVLKGDTTNWWTGSLKKSIDFCLSHGCDYIISLNADVLITPEIVYQLINVSKNNSNAIVASLVVDIKNPSKIAWSGSKFEKVHRYVPIYASRYFVKSGNEINDVPNVAYEVDEVHGRGVLIPRVVLDEIGNYDSKLFPHYGGDNDFSLRAKNNNLKMLVDPSSIAKVYSDNTSIDILEYDSFLHKLVSIKNYLFLRKNGEAIFVWWKMYRRHLPLRYLIQSYLFIIVLNIYRRIMR